MGRGNMNEAKLQVRQTESGLQVRLHVQPRAKHFAIAGVFNGALRVKVAAPPTDDAANRALIRSLSELLGVPKSCLHILAGLKSRNKILRIDRLSLSDFLERIKAAQVKE